MRLVPRVGRYFLLVALVLLGIGVFRRINLLMLLGDALLVMALLNLLAAGWNVSGLQGCRRVGEWLFARTPCSVEVQVRNPNRRDRLGLRIEEQAPGGGWRVGGGGRRVAFSLHPPPSTRSSPLRRGSSIGCPVEIVSTGAGR